MKLSIKAYYSPSTVHQCLDILDSHEGTAVIIAGGTDLLLDLKNKRKKAEVLVDVSKISEMRTIDLDEDYVYIGAAVTHSEVTRSGLIHKYAPILAKACATIGSPQIRNIGTLGGNVVNAMPAADASLALCALRAQAQLVSKQSVRWEEVSNLYAGVGRSKVDSSKEIIVRFRFRALKGRVGSSYQRLAKRRALSLPVVNVATVVEVDQQHFKDVSIFIGPVSWRPFRAYDAEDFLRGKRLNADNISRAAEIVYDIVKPRDSIRGSAEYKREMAKVLSMRALQEATQEALNRDKTTASIE